MPAQKFGGDKCLARFPDQCRLMGRHAVAALK
jgi:hypothetical protein